MMICIYQSGMLNGTFRYLCQINQDPEHLEKTFQAAMDVIEHFQKAYAEGHTEQ